MHAFVSVTCKINKKILKRVHDFYHALWLSSAESFTRSTSQVIVQRPLFYTASPNPLVHIKLITLQHTLTVPYFLKKIITGKSLNSSEGIQKVSIKES